MLSEFLNTKEAAAVLGMSTQWLEIGRCKGYGPPFTKIGRSVRYLRSVLIDWALKHTKDPSKTGGCIHE